MRAYTYPKMFRFTGLIELTYRDYSTISTSYGRRTESGWTSFEQRYRLGLQGYIYHPKLVTFSTSVTFRKEKTEVKENPENEWEAKDINYDLSASFLSTRPVSLDVYASKTDSTVEGWSTPNDITSNSYGATLGFIKNRFPSIRIEYNHWDYTIERMRGWRVFDESKELVVERKLVKEKTEMDRYSVNINGFLNFINTRYNIMGDFSEHSDPIRNYTGKNISTSTHTIIKKENMLSTSFQYSDIYNTQLTRFATDLRLRPRGRLYHSYGYEYLTSETEKGKTDSHTISSSLRYRFSRRIHGNANFRYTVGKKDGVSEESYDVDAGLNYGRLIRNFDFTSYYKFSFGKEKINGESKFMWHTLGLGLATRKFRWGKVYLDYDFSYRTFDFAYETLQQTDMKTGQTDAIEHSLRMGINGRGPGRAYWTVEAEGRIFDSKTKRGGGGFWFGEEYWAEKIRHYTLTGDIGYPIGRKGTAVFRASYTTGETNSIGIKRYYYEGRLNYRIFRNLNLLARWREEWQSKGWWAGTTAVESRDYGIKTREYEFDLYYMFRRVTLSLEYNAYKTEEGPSITEAKRLYLRLSRRF